MSDSKKPFKCDEKARIDLIESVRRSFGWITEVSSRGTSQAESSAHRETPEPKRDDRIPIGPPDV